MFRSLASQLLGSEDHHLAVRTLITRFENLNKERFEGFLIASVNAPTMQEHNLLESLCDLEPGEHMLS